MQVGEIEPDGDDGIGEVIDVDIFEIDIDVGVMGVLDNEILADVASEHMFVSTASMMYPS